MANGSLQVAAMRRDADAISRTFAQCEQTCLKVGARLGDAIPGLSDLAGLFETLSLSLESDEFHAAGLDLQAVARDIEATGNELDDESKALAALLGLNKGIATQITNLSASVRTIAALIFNVKIEAASLQQSADNMIDFADGLQRLVIKAQRALDEYQSRHNKLYGLLQRSCETQTRFQKGHQARLLSIAAEIVGSLEDVAERRREIASALAEIGAQSQHIGMQIGQGVVALQVGDSTRQRIEHAHKALHVAADGLEAGPTSHIWAGLVDAQDEIEPDSIAARICRLQSLQVDAALDDFAREMNNIESLLQGLSDDAGELATRGKALFGSNSSGANSFLEDLEQKLKAAHDIIDECRRARAVVDQATSSVGVTMADLNERAAGLAEIVVDMTMIGMNAILKSSRLGQRGKGLNIIAQELRNCATGVVLGIKALPPALQEVITFVEQFSEAGRAHNAEHMTALGERMSVAIASFRLSGAKMTDALTRLGKDTEGVRTILDEATSRLADRNDVTETLLQATTSIDELAFRIADPDDSGAQDAILIDRLLRGNYTMACERQIHDAFIGDASGQPPVNSWVSRDVHAETETELAEDCFL